MERQRYALAYQRGQTHYWQEQHRRTREREEKLKQELAEAHGTIRTLQQQLRGHSSETQASQQPATLPSKPTCKKATRPAARQPGSTPAHSSHLPTVDTTLSLDEAERCCPHCGEHYQEIAGTSDGEVLEIEVKAGQLQLAYCWAHVRRHFLMVLAGWPELAEWAWLERIATLYHLQQRRRVALSADTLSVPSTDVPATDQTPDTTLASKSIADQALHDHVDQMRVQRDLKLQLPRLRQCQQRILRSLVFHWQGLTLLLKHPHVPLDNNTAERVQRGPVVGRKNFYGSGSRWSGQLAAMHRAHQALKRLIDRLPANTMAC
jgi:Zn finger protein HypA/HybF involved in hydrogenase expression